MSDTTVQAASYTDDEVFGALIEYLQSRIDQGFTRYYDFKPFDAGSDVGYGVSFCTYSDRAGAASCPVGAVIAAVDPQAFGVLHLFEWDMPEIEDEGPQMIGFQDLVFQVDNGFSNWRSEEVQGLSRFTRKQVNSLRDIQFRNDQGATLETLLEVAEGHRAAIDVA